MITTLRERIPFINSWLLAGVFFSIPLTVAPADWLAILVATRASQNLQDLIGKASAVIHGERNVIDQAQIDELMML